MRLFKFSGGAAGVIALIAVFSIMCSPVESSEWALAEAGEARAVVVLAETAGPVEHRAARELGYFLSGVTGAEIEVSNAPARGKYPIWVGIPANNPQARRYRLESRAAVLCDEGFILRSGRDGLVISAKKPLGVLFGAYAFLEEHAGMRWFHPGEEGEYRPYRPDLKIGRIDEDRNPAFKRRTITFGGSAVIAKTEESWDWIARNRMVFAARADVAEMYSAIFDEIGVLKTGGGHILNQIVPNELFDEHPEYFGLYDGERRKHYWELYQPCTTHPEVISLSHRYLSDWFDKHPEGRFTLNNNDYPRFCECENCVALDPEGEIGRTGGTLSTRFFTFKNEVARRVWEDYSEADINTLAYQNFRLPPLGVEPDSRLVVMLTDHGRCFRHSLGDENCRANSFFRDMYEGWSEFGNRLNNFTYYNTGIGGWVINRPVEKVVAEDLRYMRDLGFEYWNMRTIPMDGEWGYIVRAGGDPTRNREYWRANMHMNWIQAKLAWDPDLDFEELLRDFNIKYYGPAGEAMHRFRTMKLRLWEETAGHFMYGGSYTLYGKSLMAPGAPGDMQRLLDEAEQAAAGNEKYLARVAKDREIFENTWLAGYEEYKQRPDEPVQASRVSEPVVIDGNLDERDWHESGRITGFRHADGSRAEIQTYVRVLFDDENLYIGLEMEEPETDLLRMRASGRDDSRIWQDDTIEVMIDPDGEGMRYVHFAVNPAGSFRDSERDIGMPTAGDPSFDAGAEVSSRVDFEGRWIVEMKVPAESIGGEIVPGSSWTMNVVRVRRAGAEAASVSSWADGQVHEPNSFRRVVFGAGQSVIRNGNLAGIVPATERQRESRGVTTENFLADWGVNARQAGVREGPVNVLLLEGGVIYQYMRIPADARNLTGEIVASGEGNLSVRFRMSFSHPFKEEKVTRLDPFPLRDEPSSFRFTYDRAEGEHGFVYISASSAAEIRHISIMGE